MSTVRGVIAGRTRLVWASIRDSLWFAPALAVAMAIILAVVAVSLPAPEIGSRMARVWLFGGGAEGARGMLSAIAGSLITVTGVVFSVTIVALQLASSQFTPRVLRSFVADRTNQVVLGIFIGTFTYSLLVLRTIRSAADDRDLHVPQVAVLLAMILLLVSIGALIVFVNHAARSIQASVILDRETTLSLARIAHLFPAELSEPEWHAVDAPVFPTAEGRTIEARQAGYLQMVSTDALDELADGRRLTVRMDVRVGGFVVPGQALATAWPAGLADDEVKDTVREAFHLGPERTPEQDAEYGIVEISDIALRALSPGINDPTTAMLCVDRLAELLVALARHRPPPPVRDADDGTLRFVARHTTFERAAGIAFDQVRHNGASNPVVLGKLLGTIEVLLPLVPADNRAVLVSHIEAIAESAAVSIGHTGDRARVEALVAQVRKVAGALEGRG